MNTVVSSRRTEGRTRLFSHAMWAVLAAIALTWMGCVDTPTGPNNGLILADGEAWVDVDGNQGYVLRHDGTILYLYQYSGYWESDLIGTYRLGANNTITVDIDALQPPVHATCTYTIEGTGIGATVTATFDNSIAPITAVRTRVNIPTNPPPPPPATGGNLVLGVNEAWTTGDAVDVIGLIFRSNGQFAGIGKEGGIWYEEFGGTWSASGSNVTITIDGESITWPYSVTGNALTITIDGETLTFTKTSNVIVVEEGGGGITPPTTTPTPLTENVWTNGSITSSTPDRAAWYSFNVSSGRTYYVLWDDEYSGPETGTLDIKVDVLYSDGTLIFEGDDWSSTPLSFTAGRTETVLIRVTPVLSGNTGTFGVMWTTTNPNGGGNPVVPGTGGNLVLGANEAWVATLDGESAGIIFKADNDLVVIVPIEGLGWAGAVAGTWSTSGSNITLIIDGEAMSGTYSVSGSSLAITIDGETELFTRTGNITYIDISGLMKSRADIKLPKFFSKKGDTQALTEASGVKPSALGKSRAKVKENVTLPRLFSKNTR